MAMRATRVHGYPYHAFSVSITVAARLIANVYVAVFNNPPPELVTVMPVDPSGRRSAR
ncbi:MAG: hypothetical protein QXQ92_06545 [Candidatus Nezhaarchaeales archaeon]